MKKRRGTFSVLPVAMDNLLELIIRLLQLLPQCAALLVLTAAAWFLLRLLRANLSKTELQPVDYLEFFQKLKEEGELTEEEFRIIKGLVSLQTIRRFNESKPDFSP